MNKNATRPRSIKEQRKVKTHTGRIGQGVGFPSGGSTGGGWIMDIEERDRLQKKGLKTIYKPR